MAAEAWRDDETEAEGANRGREKHTVVMEFPAASVDWETALADVQAGLTGFPLLM